MRTMGRTLRFAAALVAVTAGVTATVSSAATLTLDASQRFQKMAGIGSNVNVNSWNGGALKPALDALVDQAGQPVLRVVRDPMNWVASESDIAKLHALDPATLTRIYEAPKMQDIWNTIGYLNQKGLGGNQLILNFMGWTPPWLGGSGAYGSPSYITAGKEPAFATMVASLVYYARRVKGLDFGLLAPMNEEDWDAKEGPQVPYAQYVTVLKAVIAELNAMGLADVRLVGPDTATPYPVNYVTAMMADATVAGRLDHLSFHTYGSSAYPLTAYAGKDYWLTETAQWCDTCDQNGTPSQGEWGFARDTSDIFLDDVAHDFAAVLVWEAFDGFYYHHNSDSSWGLLSNKTVPLYSKRKRFYTLAQLSAFIRPGTTRVALSTPVGIKAVAFYDASRGQLAIVGHNTSGLAIVLNGQLNNVPVALSSLAHYQTDSGSKNLQRVADVAVAAQAFTVSIPADTFFSLANFAPASSLQVASISPVSGPAAGGTTVTIRGRGFAAPASVTIGGVAATAVSLTSSTLLTAVSGAHAAGLADVTVTAPGPQSATLTQGFAYATPPPAASFFTVSPCRAADTRAAQAPALGPGERRTLPVAGQCGVPTSATAVALNVTVTSPAAQGFVRVTAGDGLSETSTLNFTPGLTRANNALVVLASDGSGTVAVTNGSAGTTHVLLDVTGYFE